MGIRKNLDKVVQKYNAKSGVSKIPWGLLENFLVAANAGSIRLASEELGVNHSTVSRQLATLENLLGQKVFDRYSHGLELNGFGQGLFEHVKSMDSGFDRLSMYLNNYKDEITGSVHLTLGDSMLPMVLPVIRGLQEQHTGLQVQLSVTNHLARMEKGEADIALRITPDPPEHLVGHHLANLSVACYVSRDLYEKNIQPMRWVTWDLDQSTTGESALDQYLKDKPVACKVDSSAAMMAAVKAGLGAGIMLSIFADQEPDLVRIDLPSQGPAIPLWLLYHPQLRTSAKVQVIVNAVKGAFRERENT